MFYCFILEYISLENYFFSFYAYLGFIYFFILEVLNCNNIWIRLIIVKW
jgi:hypothetical protein